MTVGSPLEKLFHACYIYGKIYCMSPTSVSNPIEYFTNLQNCKFLDNIVNMWGYPAGYYPSLDIRQEVQKVVAKVRPATRKWGGMKYEITDLENTHIFRSQRTGGDVTKHLIQIFTAGGYPCGGAPAAFDPNQDLQNLMLLDDIVHGATGGNAAFTSSFLFQQTRSASVSAALISPQMGLLSVGGTSALSSSIVRYVAEHTVPYPEDLGQHSICNPMYKASLPVEDLFNPSYPTINIIELYEGVHNTYRVDIIDIKPRGYLRQKLYTLLYMLINRGTASKLHPNVIIRPCSDHVDGYGTQVITSMELCTRAHFDK